MIKKCFTLALAAAFVFGCSSDDDNQNPPDPVGFQGEIDWVQTFGGSNEESARSIIPTTDGGFAIIGLTNSNDGDITDKTLLVNDYWVIKLDAEGNQQWNATYGGSGDDQGQAIVQTLDGGFALAGYSMSADGDGSNNEGFHDNWVVKTDASGNIQWERSFGFAGHDHAYDILQTEDGGYFVSGFLDVTGSNGEGNSGEIGRSSLTAHGVGEFWANKLDANGDLVWRRFFGGTNNDRAFSVVQAEDGGFVLAGASESQDFDISEGNGSYDFWVVKVSATGDLVWERSYGGSGIDHAESITRTSDNGFMVVGRSNSTDGDISNNKGNADLWLLKLSDSGKMIWEKTFGGSEFENGESIIPSQDGGFYIAGNSRSNNTDLTENFGENDIWVIKIDDSGSLQWEKSIGGAGLDFGFDLLETAEGELMVVGETESSDNHITENKGLKDLVVIKLK
ncbi:hypothetical protein GWK08_06915 [Leptobacterium flavescens]|uniref:Bulb-type lectin domain-containing protein n=1 Tax=Leptobacterium flavescens TaxID=472055 RepID=A0A6P0UQM3_9FLAO|nr:hypothetical protein [Leptobacterium flavescens]NER13163.1 hypothetical protein [Leptobacterium flavescens]